MDVQLQFFVIGVMVLLGLSFLSYPQREYSNLWVGIFVLLAVVNVMAYKFHPKVITGATLIFLGSLLYRLVICYVHDMNDCLRWLLALIPLNFVMVLLQLVGHDFINENFGGICGLMMSPSHLGVLMVLLIPLVLAKGRWLAFLAIFCIFASKSITPILGLVGALIFYYWHKGRSKVLISFCAISLIGGAISLNGFSYTKLKLLGRLEVWEQSLRWAFTKPLTGMGLGSFAEISKTFQSWQGWWQTPQNTYIGLLFAIGVPAIIILFSFLIDLYKRTEPHLKNGKVLPFASSLMGLLIIMMGQSCMQYARIFVPAIAIVAFLEIKIREVTNGV